ncbi:MAG: ORC1-type DNA replication protein [Candidatus Bathyarchaeia archaeon]
MLSSTYSYRTVFKDETKLDINYIPPKLPHRQLQLQLLNKFFQYTLQTPGKMSLHVLITGSVGTGKTALAQFFGQNILKEAEKHKVNLHYVHVNCRQQKGSLFLVLQQIAQHFHPTFPKRGYSAEELLHMVLQILDDQNAYLILTLDEMEPLIQREGSDALYKLTRIQENRLNKPKRLSLICVLREAKFFEILDESTKSTLQHNIIHLNQYSKFQLHDIINDRVALAFKHGTMSPESVELIAELAEMENGNARYAIELLWRSGKYADVMELSEVTPECVRKASASVYPSVRKDEIALLGFHEKLVLLGLARRFKQSGKAYLSMGEAEEAYAIVCEEFDEKPRAHTQFWKYVQELSASGIIKTRLSGNDFHGKTTLISLPWTPASELEEELIKTLYSKRE